MSYCCLGSHASAVQHRSIGEAYGVFALRRGMREISVSERRCAESGILLRFPGWISGSTLVALSAGSTQPSQLATRSTLTDSAEHQRVERVDLE